MASVFESFGIIYYILRAEEYSQVATTLSIIGLSHDIVVIIIILNAGSSLTEEAEKTGVIISKLVNESKCDLLQKVDFLFFMAQIKSRNLNVQNFMFKINWNVLLCVSL